jgi:hypothetical protein
MILFQIAEISAVQKIDLYKTKLDKKSIFYTKILKYDKQP